MRLKADFLCYESFLFLIFSLHFQGQSGAICVKTKQAIIIACYNDKIQPGNATAVAEKVADYLIGRNIFSFRSFLFVMNNPSICSNSSTFNNSLHGIPCSSNLFLFHMGKNIQSIISVPFLIYTSLSFLFFFLSSSKSSESLSFFLSSLKSIL